MRILRLPPLSTRLKLTVILLVALVAIAVPVAAIYYQTQQAKSEATANGPFSIIWGDPYLAPRTAQGAGSESLTITGRVTGQPNMTGYYGYATINLYGTLQAEWSSSGTTYALVADFSLSSYQTSYQEVSIDPSSDSFYVSFMDYAASFSVNGSVTHSSGEAGIKAAPPGYFAQEGRSRVTTFILYSPSLGLPQFVIRWSQASQTINGVQLPAAGQFSQTVRITGWT